MELTIEEKAYAALKKEFKKILKKLNTKKEKMEEVEVTPFVTNGEAYYSEDELLDAYGCYIISASVKDKGIRFFREHVADENKEVLEKEIQMLSRLIEGLVSERQAMEE